MSRTAALLGLLIAAGVGRTGDVKAAPARSCIAVDSESTGDHLQCVAADVPLMTARRCIDQSHHIPSWSGNPHPQCSVRWETLPESKGSSLVAAWYRWPEPDLPKLSRCLDVVTLVIYLNQRGSPTVRPLYVTQERESILFLKGTTLHSVGQERLIDLTICLNGTGGCGQDFLAWRGDHLTPVLENYRNQFNDALPKGYITYKSPHIDLDSMTIEGGGWRNAKDANCCPTLRMRCRVAFAGRNTRLSHCAVEQIIREPGMPVQ